MGRAKALIETVGEDQEFEMANFDPASTGLGYVVWFSGDPLTKHPGPRGHLRIKGKYYPFSIDGPVVWLAKAAPGVSSKEFQRLAEFVRLNRPALLAYWNGEIGTFGVVRLLQKLV